MPITASGSGASRVLMIENDADSTGGLGFSAAQMMAAFPADVLALGTNPESYRFKATVQNGDGVNSNPTTWLESKVTIHFDSGFTYRTSSVGRANRWTKWGTIVNGADGEPIGYDGPEVYFGAATTLSGNLILGGCDLRNYSAGAAGQVLILPSLAGCTADVVDTDVYTGGTQGYGNNTQALTRLRRLTAAGFGAGAFGRLVQFNCPDSDFVTIAFPSGTTKMQTNGVIVLRNPRFIGPTTSPDVILGTSGFFESPTWSRAVAPYQTTNVEEYFPLIGAVLAGGVRVANALVELFDRVNRKVVSVRTTSLGTLPVFAQASSPTFPGNGTPLNNVLAVVQSADGGATSGYMGPWRIEVNGDGAIAGYPKFTDYLEASYETFVVSGNTYRQYSPIGFTVDLAAPNATADIPFWNENDIAAMILGAGGQTVSVAGVDTVGLVEHRSIEAMDSDGGPMIGEVIVVTVKKNSLPALAIGVNMGAEGVTRRVRDMRDVYDGALVEVFLADD